MLLTSFPSMASGESLLCCAFAYVIINRREGESSQGGTQQACAPWEIP
jgi:hypothetical protein